MAMATVPITAMATATGRRRSSVTDLHWYVAYVKSCQERKVAEALGNMGVGYYLPVQREVHQWSDRKKIVARLVLPRMIFIRTTEAGRLGPMRVIPGLLRYMSNKGPYNPVIIRDAEMESFRAMVEHSGRNVSMNGEALVPGDRVRIVHGPLTGYEFELVSIGDARCLGVRLGSLGYATMDLSADALEKI